MHQSEPANGFPLLRWGSLLLRPLDRLQEGCSTLESAALIYSQAMDGPAAATAVDLCLAALQPKGEAPAGDNAGGAGGCRPQVTGPELCALETRPRSYPIPHSFLSADIPPSDPPPPKS